MNHAVDGSISVRGVKIFSCAFSYVTTYFITYFTYAFHNACILLVDEKIWIFILLSIGKWSWRCQEDLYLLDFIRIKVSRSQTQRSLLSLLVNNKSSQYFKSHFLYLAIATLPHLTSGRLHFMRKHITDMCSVMLYLLKTEQPFLGPWKIKMYLFI